MKPSPKIRQLCIAIALVSLTSCATKPVNHKAKSLGNRYFYGEGVPQDYAKAVADYTNRPVMYFGGQRLSSLANDERLNLAYCYENGLGTYRNPYEAFQIYENLTIHGYKPSGIRLARCYAYGRGTVRNGALALRLCQELAKEGDLEAMALMSDIYETGNGVPQDHAKAVYWLEKGAQAGSPMAMYNYGVHLGFGVGVKADYEKAAEWLMKADEAGISKARELRLEVIKQGGWPSFIAHTQREQAKAAKIQSEREKAAMVTLGALALLAWGVQNSGDSGNSNQGWNSPFTPQEEAYNERAGRNAENERQAAAARRQAEQEDFQRRQQEERDRVNRSLTNPGF